MEQLSGIQIIIAGYRRCGTTYLHDFFSSIEEVNVLKKKEEDRLLISSKLWESGVKPYITNKDSYVSVIVHPMLVVRPECLRVLVECCETPMVVFLRRPAYERAKSEFQMLCSISSGADGNLEHYSGLAQQAICHSQYNQLEAEIERICPGLQSLLIPYEKALSDPLVLLRAATRQAHRYSIDVSVMRPHQIEFDQNSSLARQPLKPGPLPTIVRKAYSWLIRSSYVSYQLAKFLKKSSLGRSATSRLRGADTRLAKIFEKEWRVSRDSIVR